MKLWCGLIILLIGFAGCAGEDKAPGLRIAVASSMRPLFEELARQFQNEQGISVEIVAGSSGALTAQIEHGAPFDLFCAASPRYTRHLCKTNSNWPEPRELCQGATCLLSSVPIHNLNRLLDSDIQTISLPNPESAPYGAATQSLLIDHGLWNALKNKIVFTPNAAVAVQQFQSGLVDVAFSAKSLVTSLSPPPKHLLFNPSWGHPVTHSLLSLKDSKMGEKFQRFLFSNESEKTFTRFGFKFNVSTSINIRMN